MQVRQVCYAEFSQLTDSFATFRRKISALHRRGWRRRWWIWQRIFPKGSEQEPCYKNVFGSGILRHSSVIPVFHLSRREWIFRTLLTIWCTYWDIEKALALALAALFRDLGQFSPRYWSSLWGDKERLVCHSAREEWRRDAHFLLFIARLSAETW